MKLIGEIYLFLKLSVDNFTDEVNVNSFSYAYIKFVIFQNDIKLAEVDGQDKVSIAKSRKIVFQRPSIGSWYRVAPTVYELMKLCDSLKTNFSNSQSTRLKLADKIYERALVSL